MKTASILALAFLLAVATAVSVQATDYYQPREFSPKWVVNVWTHLCYLGAPGALFWALTFLPWPAQFGGVWVTGFFAILIALGKYKDLQTQYYNFTHIYYPLTGVTLQ
jgi:hypothetical protein